MGEIVILADGDRIGRARVAKGAVMLDVSIANDADLDALLATLHDTISAARAMA